MFLAGEGWWMGFKSIEQLSQSSEVEHNPKMSISFFWVKRGCGWGLSPSTSPANHQKLSITQKWAFHFFGWRGVADGVWVHRPAQLIIRSWPKSKNEDFIFWLKRGGGWGLSPSTSLANHQKLIVIQKQAFNFIGWRWVVDGVWVHWPVWPKSEVDCNTKMNISFYWLERVGRWDSSPSTSPADHQKFNIIQKWGFHFIGWRGVVDGVWVHQPAQPIIRSWT